MLLKKFRQLFGGRNAEGNYEYIFKIILWALFLGLMVLIISFIFIKFGAKS